MIEPHAERDTLRADVHVGCSGWQYRHWRGRFYPANVPRTQWFEYYASQFDTVEINNTFYRLPERSTFKAWKSRAPREFRFAIKASRFLTHMKRLKEPKEPIERLFAHAGVLGQMLGPMLYQLPTGWPLNIDRLTVFLKNLPRLRRHAIEFRDPSWYTKEVFALLARYRVTCCLHDMAGSASGPVVVGPFVYLRLHGTAKYSGRYPDRTLREWASWLVEQLRSGRPVYAYFNNDAGGDAPFDAIRLRDFVKRAFPESAPLSFTKGK